MKKSCKVIFSLVLMLLMVMGLAATAFADSPSITFNGFTSGFDFQPGSEYTETDLFGNFKNVMPGDTVTESITFTNSATDCDFVNLYMRAEAHDETENPLSEKVAASGETVATMTDFLSKLSMKVWNGTELIYSASPDQLDGLKDNVFLGTFRTGDTTTLRVELSVPIELGNEYANRVGEVDWIFHVEAYNESQLTVRKVWSDGNSLHRNDSVTVNLLKDGEIERSQELNAENGWTYTFDRLAEGHIWTVEEAVVPDGYTVGYKTEGNMTVITNTKKDAPAPSEPLDITVKKVWGGDDPSLRPKSVTVTLYDGERAYESVRLGEWNNWSYTWRSDSACGNWQVAETSIPKGYTPYYRVTDGVVIITNNKTLIQTGQLNWPVFVFGGAGLILVSLGGVMLARRRKHDNA